jgi:hypothetical protein
MLLIVSPRTPYSKRVSKAILLISFTRSLSCSMFLLLPFPLSLEGEPRISSLTEVEWEEVFFLVGDFLRGGEI